ncbi:hypothetical protein N9A94_08375, partial [Akkermansiaceae bacterium]|nr:hypothetical protein [Akkermansiaceae bacterium]
MKLLATLALILTTTLSANPSPDELLGALEKAFSDRAAKLPEANEKGLQAGDRLNALLDLRYLTVLESILAELNT